MEDTAESAGDSAEELQGFSERFSGAMTAAVSALAIGAAGLLSQVPVLGEAFSGLGALVAAVAFQMDKVLRPVVSPLTDLFYEWSAAIYEADGAIGTFIGVFSTIASVAVFVVAALIQLGGIISAFGGYFTIATTAIAGFLPSLATVISVATALGSVILTVGSVIVGAIGTIVGAIASLPAALLIAIAAVIAFAAAYALNLGGVRDKTNSILGDVWGFFTQLGSDLAEWGSGVLGSVIEAFRNLSGALGDWAADLAQDAYDWGTGLVERFIAGLKNALDAAGGFLGSVADQLGIDLPNINQNATVTATGGGGGGRGGRGGRFRGRGGSNGGTTLDGRQLTESTGRYRSGPSRRRGV